MAPKGYVVGLACLVEKDNWEISYRVRARWMTGVLCILLPLTLSAANHPKTSKKVTEPAVRQYLADHPELLKELVEERVHQYLTDHPEVVAEAMERYQVREEKKRTKLVSDAITVRREELYSDAMTPAAGPVDHAVQIVEFFDYRCAFCKRVDPAVRKLLNENPNLRVVFKELPVLGPESLLAAKASAAAYKQGAYLKFHEALISENGTVTLESIERIATRVGLDVAKLEKDMESAEVTATIERTRELAGALQIEATPSFVIGGEVVRGALAEDDLRSRIARLQAQ
jgi:protein-disulfide isomerase